jgi:hypothetical protein
VNFQTKDTVGSSAPWSTVDRVTECKVAVVGAGPYGLSAVAHLKAKGIAARAFGRPMDFWATKMPAGMLLRSPRPASSISDPVPAYTLEDYEKAVSIPPSAPVPLERFVDYGLWFQQQLSPDLDEREVATVERSEAGFKLTLEDGVTFRCKRVVVAAGIGPFQKIPEVFRSLKEGKQVSHCYSGCDVQSFARKRVIVIGAGQSALECAALLHESGSQVEILARIPGLRWIGGHPWLHNLGPISAALYSKHDIGPAGISRLVASPNLVKRIPLKLRDKIRTRAVRPAGSQWLPPRLERVKVTTGRAVAAVDSTAHQVRLRLDDGSERVADHVLLGTGYQVDISRYSFLSPQLAKSIHTLDGYPVLGSGFRSSVPGLHFVGATAARSFGPLLYFVTGTEFASRELVVSIAKDRSVAQ